MVLVTNLQRNQNIDDMPKRVMPVCTETMVNIGTMHTVFWLWPLKCVDLFMRSRMCAITFTIGVNFLVIMDHHDEF